MTATIIPAAGQGILYAQQGPGASPGYAALDVRRAISGVVQEGVLETGVGGTDFMVQQRVAGANMQVEIAMPNNGMAAVNGDTINGQGLYFVPSASGNYLEAIATADATNPRIDQVILEIQDNAIDGTGGNQARTRVLTGTPTSGANLTNRTGAAALPGSALLLADVLVDAAVGSIVNAKIRDRRKWARGAFVRQVYTGGDITTASGSFVTLSTLIPRIECSGRPVRMALLGRWAHSVAAGFGALRPTIDGAAIDSTADYYTQTFSTAAGFAGLHAEYVFVPAAGSHALEWNVRTSGATLTLSATAGQPLVIVVEELVRQNTANNPLTSG
jgi:hypothetical protein